MSGALLSLPLVVEGSKLKKRDVCLIANACHLVSQAPRNLAQQVCSSDVSCHVVSCVLHACCQAAESRRNNVDFVLFGAIRSLSFLGSELQAAKLLMECVGDAMIARAIVLALRVVSDIAEGCPVWSACLSDLMMLVINCFMSSGNIASERALFRQICNKDVLYGLFFNGFSSVPLSNEMKCVMAWYVCVLACLMAQMLLLARKLRETSLLAKGFADVFSNNVMKSICAYCAWYIMEYRVDIDVDIVIAFFVLLLCLASMKPNIFDVDKELRESITKLVVVVLKNIQDPIIQVVQKSLEMRTALDLFSVVSPRDLYSRLIHGGDLDSTVELCCWCGKLADVPCFECPRCQRAFYCEQWCQMSHWNIHKDVCCK